MFTTITTHTLASPIFTSDAKICSMALASISSLISSLALPCSQVAFSGRIPDTGDGFVLLDSRIIPDNAMVGEKIKPEELHCLVYEVQEKTDPEPVPKDGNSRISKFMSIVNWVTLALGKNIFSISLSTLKTTKVWTTTVYSERRCNQSRNLTVEIRK